MAKSKKNKTVGGILIMAVLGFAYVMMTRMSRADALKILADSGHTNAVLADPRAYQDGYLIAWAKSIQNGQSLFTYQGKQFIAETGTSK